MLEIEFNILNWQRTRYFAIGMRNIIEKSNGVYLFCNRGAPLSFFPLGTLPTLLQCFLAGLASIIALSFSRSSRLRFSRDAFPCNYLRSALRSSRATETRIHCPANDLLQRLFSCNRVKSPSKPLVKHCLPRSVAFRYFLSTGVRVFPPGYSLAFFRVTNARHRRCRSPCTETVPSVRFTPSWNRACGVFEILLPSSRSPAPLQKVSCRRAKTTRRRRGARGTGNR
jgi:hypothetical protein